MSTKQNPLPPTIGKPAPVSATPAKAASNPLPPTLTKSVTLSSAALSAEPDVSTKSVSVADPAPSSSSDQLTAEQQAQLDFVCLQQLKKLSELDYNTKSASFSMWQVDSIKLIVGHLSSSNEELKRLSISMFDQYITWRSFQPDNLLPPGATTMIPSVAELNAMKP